MTTRTPRALPTALLVLLAVGCSGSDDAAQRPSPTASASAPSAAAPSEDPKTTAPAQAPTVTGAGSRFTPPKDPTAKTAKAEAGDDCFGLEDLGFQALACRDFQSKLGRAVAMVETKGQEERDLVWTLGARAELALRAVRTSTPSDGTGSDVGATTQLRITDLAEDSTPKAVFLTPKGSDVNDAVDVVEATGQVVLHRDLNGGNAGKALGGGLETVVPTQGDRAVQTVIQYRSGAWRITAQKPVATSAAEDVNDF